MRKFLLFSTLAVGLFFIASCDDDKNSGGDNGGGTPSEIVLSVFDTFETGQFDEGAAEIVAHDPGSQRVFVVNANDDRIDILDISNIGSSLSADTLSNLLLLSSIDVAADVPEAGGINSVDVHNGLVAVAVQNDDDSKNGFVAFYNEAGTPQNVFDGATRNFVEVGNLPDALTFSPNGSKILVSNEGEQGEDAQENPVDPKGSISIIDLGFGLPAADSQTTTLDFSAFDGNIDPDVKLEPGKLPSVDLEPEFGAFSADGQTAMVVLQEANAFAMVNIASKTITSIKSLGFKNHSLPGNALDASNEDGVINIQNWPVLGMYQPDGIESYNVNGQTYFVTANEGDARDPEEARVADVTLDPASFPNAATLQLEENLGRINITTWLGNNDDDDDFEELFTFGARSFTIWDSNGNLVWDSGDDLEQITAQMIPNFFNSTNDDNDSFDNRSDDKGPEPEGVDVGEVNGQHYAFIGLERVGGLIVYNITDPTNPSFVQYLNNRDFGADAEISGAGDLAPEGIKFVSASDSPIGVPLVIVGNEVSGTTTIYRID